MRTLSLLKGLLNTSQDQSGCYELGCCKDVINPVGRRGKIPSSRLQLAETRAPIIFVCELVVNVAGSSWTFSVLCTSCWKNGGNRLGLIEPMYVIKVGEMAEIAWGS